MGEQIFKHAAREPAHPPGRQLVSLDPEAIDTIDVKHIAKLSGCDRLSPFLDQPIVSGILIDPYRQFQSIRPALKNVIDRLDPESIALNYSENDPAADGLTVGMYRTLRETFAGTPYADRFVSGEAFVASLRGRKSSGEIMLIREAIKTTEKLYADLGATLAVGQSEREIANTLQNVRTGGAPEGSRW